MYAKRHENVSVAKVFNRENLFKCACESVSERMQVIISECMKVCNNLLIRKNAQEQACKSACGSRYDWLIRKSA